MNKPFVFDLHQDEWQLWRDLGWPTTTWHWGRDLGNFREIVIAGEWAEDFRVWQILRDWHSDYFDRLWQERQATAEETAEPRDPDHK